MTRLNLLPWREIRRKELDRQLLTIAIGAWLLMGLAVFFGHLHATTLIENQNTRNQFLEEEIKKVEAQIKEIDGLKRQRQALIARMRVIEQLQAKRTQIVHVFDDLVRQMPEGVYLNSLAQRDNALTFTGVAQSNARVSALMRNLEKSSWFTGPDLDVINVAPQGGARVSQFTLRVKSTPQKKEPQGESQRPQ